MADTILVTKVGEPGLRIRISKDEFEKNGESYVEEEEGCEGGLSYDQLSAAEKKAVDKEQVARQERLDEAADPLDEAE